MFVEDAHRCLEGDPPRSSLKQFAAMYIARELMTGGYGLGTPPDNATVFSDELEEYACAGEAHAVPINKWPSHVRKRASGVTVGGNARDVSFILANTLLAHDMTRNLELTQLIGRTLKENLLTPEQAAAVASVVEFNNQDVSRFEWQAGCLVDETRIFPDACFSSPEERQMLLSQADILDFILNGGRKYRDAALREQKELTAIEELCKTFRLAPGPTGIFVPLRKHILVARTIAEAQQLACDRRDLIFAMSPREFEEFMASIFKNLDFEVELTKTTHDGGADLICMRTLHGIPIRLAVELKRYRNKAVDVQLVRSFVGSNETWRANRLLYVTTSRYTKGAHDYADNYAAHILTLKDYDQITEWCKEVQQRPNPIL